MFATLQTLAKEQMAAFEREIGFPTSLTFEEVLAIMMDVYHKDGYDFTGMVANGTGRDDFAEWVAQMEADFGDVADAEFASRSGIPMF